MHLIDAVNLFGRGYVPIKNGCKNMFFSFHNEDERELNDSEFDLAKRNQGT